MTPAASSRTLVASVRKSAAELKRRLYASLPFGYRLARVMIHLAAEWADDFGRVILAEMIKAQIAGLPTVGGKLPEEWLPLVQGRNGAMRLPRGSGRKFGQRVYAVTLKLLHDPLVVESAMADIATKFATGRAKFESDYSMEKAENYVLGAVLNAGRDMLRNQGRRRDEKPLPVDEEGRTLDVEDPRAWADMERNLPRSTLERIMRDVDAVNDRASDWFASKLEGKSSGEIAEDWGVSKGRVSQWETAFLPKIKKVVNKYLSAA